MTTQLSQTFSRQLVKALTPVALATVLVRNRAETNSAICHSHDFCDANQVMLDAMAELGIELDLQDESQIELITAAWNAAKANNFNVT